jgi:small subunit ribosomal protein S17
MTTEQNNSFKRKLTGVVVSDVNTQTIVVNVQRRYKHGTYSKFITKSKKYHAHDVDSKAKIGDLVTIIESRPYSKMKKWELLSINTAK